MIFVIHFRSGPWQALYALINFLSKCILHWPVLYTPIQLS